MKKPLLSLLFVPILAFSLLLPALAVGSGTGRFKARYTYTSGQFNDVSGSAWYAMAIQACVEYD